MKKNIKIKFKWNYFVIIFFAIFLGIGICTFRDYGLSGDEVIERRHSLVNHYYLRSVLKGESKANGELVFAKNSSIEKLIDNLNIERRFFKYPYKYYGVALQLPVTFIEQIFDYRLDLPAIYYMRHFFNFLIFFISLIFLYKLLSKYIIKNKKLALLSVIFMILSPRIYGDSFYNNKDLIFLSLVIINLYYCISYLDNSNIKNLLLLCFISALTINCRIIGLIFIFMVLIFKIINCRKQKKKLIKSFVFISLLTYIFYILVSPASWNNIFLYPFEVIKFFFNYHDPTSHTIQKNFYFGTWYNDYSLPWHYIPVWIVITTPILYVVLSIIGFLKKSFYYIKNRFKNIDQDWLFCNVILICILSFVIIVKPVLYTGWRHFYFIYPLIIINSIIGFDMIIHSNKKLKILIILLTIINSCYLTFWMCKNHPYQYEYFELLFRNYAIKNFDTNYWQVSNSDAMSYIANHDKNNIVVYSKIKTSSFLLPKSQRDHIKVVTDITEKDIDYIIDNSKNGTNKYKDEYQEIYYKKIDNYRLYTIYKKKIN